MNDPKQLTALIESYRNCQNELEKKELLEEILESLKPMLLKCIRHYFGNQHKEDLLQDGYAELIYRINLYDSSYTNVPILGYLKRMISCFYFSLNRRLRHNAERTCTLTYEMQEYIEDEQNNITQLVDRLDVEELMSSLNTKQRLIVREHVMHNIKLLSLCKSMNISYSYGKKLKYDALNKMKKAICF